MKKRDIEDEIEQEVEELEEAGQIPKKKIEKESIEKRKKAKKNDVVGRWSGVILFVLLFIVGLLMWVGGERQPKVQPELKFSSEKIPERSIIVK